METLNLSVEPGKVQDKDTNKDTKTYDEQFAEYYPKAAYMQPVKTILDYEKEDEAL